MFNFKPCVCIIGNQLYVLGLACIQLSFVDGKGKPIGLLGTQKPPALAYKDPLDPAMFPGLVSTDQYIIDNSKTPGTWTLFTANFVLLRKKLLLKILGRSKYKSEYFYSLNILTVIIFLHVKDDLLYECNDLIYRCND